eukprot:tig00021494_g21930.t1
MSNAVEGAVERLRGGRWRPCWLVVCGARASVHRDPTSIEPPRDVIPLRGARWGLSEDDAARFPVFEISSGHGAQVFRCTTLQEALAWLAALSSHVQLAAPAEPPLPAFAARLASSAGHRVLPLVSGHRSGPSKLDPEADPLGRCFAPVRHSCHAECASAATPPPTARVPDRFVDGRDYFAGVRAAMEGARREIFLSMWMTPEVYLTREGGLRPDARLFDVLRRKAQQARPAPPSRPSESPSNFARHAMRLLNGLHPNVKAMRARPRPPRPPAPRRPPPGP